MKALRDWVAAAERQLEAREDTLRRYILSDFSDPDVFSFLTGRVDSAHEELRRAESALAEAMEARK